MTQQKNGNKTPPSNLNPREISHKITKNHLASMDELADRMPELTNSLLAIATKSPNEQNRIKAIQAIFAILGQFEIEEQYARSQAMADALEQAKRKGLV